MFMAFMAVVIVVSAPLLGGRPGLLTNVRFERGGVLLIALVIQILITEVFRTASKPLLVSLHLITYVLAGFVLWVNRRLPGLVVIGLGTLSNSVVIALNHGTLPASEPALRSAGFTPDPADFANSGELAHPVLPWLGDIAATPFWLPFRNVISIGDVLILLGAAIFMHAVTRSLLWVWIRRGITAVSSRHGHDAAVDGRAGRRSRADRAATADQ